MKIDLNIEFDDDKNLFWRQGAADAAGRSYRLIIRRLQLFVPRLVFNSEGQKLYMENYLKPYKWTYLKESVFTSNLLTKFWSFQNNKWNLEAKTCFCIFHQQCKHQQPTSKFILVLYFQCINKSKNTESMLS